MDRIEFEMNISLRDVRGLMIRRLCTSRIVRIYYIAVIIVSFLVLIAISDTHDRSDYENLIMFITIALIFPFALGLGFASAALKISKREGKKIFFLDRQGFGSRTDTYEVYFKWERFDFIDETEKYIFIKKNRRPHITIYKHILPYETVSSIKKIIAEVPVPNKKLLPDERDKLSNHS